MDNKDLCYVVVGGAVLALIVYVAMCEGTVSSPGTEPVLAWNSPLEDVPYSYFADSHRLPGQQQIMTPHRYPNRSGTNVSTLIHFGFSAMSHPNQKDLAWMYAPPGDDYF